LEKLSKEPFGRDLAKKVCKKLKDNPKKYDLFNHHKEYCGHGIWFTGKYFELCQVYDGIPGSLICRWDKSDKFTAFLALQSDYSCSGLDKTGKYFYTEDSFMQNNQRITKKRLKDYI